MMIVEFIIEHPFRSALLADVVVSECAVLLLLWLYWHWCTAGQQLLLLAYFVIFGSYGVFIAESLSEPFQYFGVWLGALAVILNNLAVGVRLDEFLGRRHV